MFLLDLQLPGRATAVFLQKLKKLLFLGWLCHSTDTTLLGVFNELLVTVDSGNSAGLVLQPLIQPLIIVRNVLYK